ncbi:MAG: GntR family transcriptional regulator [Paenibacillus sp.]|nr:GntR family transcriptional regulator [Paenibacillus sp.]
MKQTLREQAYERIHHWIYTQALPKGSVTSEAQLSQQLKMSRTPIRAALQQLELEGYLRIVPKYGVLILESSAERVSNLLDIIISLAMFSVEQARFAQTPWLPVTGAAYGSQLMQRLAEPDPVIQPEALCEYEHELLKVLISQNGNSEMLKLFEFSSERLYWKQNTRRWRAPHRKETIGCFSLLLASITDNQEDSRLRLLEYLQLLKKTWI